MGEIMAKKFQRRRLTHQELANIEAWYSEGYAPKQIARKIGRTKAAITNLVRRIVKPGLYENVGSTGKLVQIDFSGTAPQAFKEVGTVKFKLKNSNALKPFDASEKSDVNLLRVNKPQSTDDLIKLIAALPVEAETKLKLFKSL